MPVCPIHGWSCRLRTIQHSISFFTSMSFSRLSGYPVDVFSSRALPREGRTSYSCGTDQVRPVQIGESAPCCRPCKTCHTIHPCSGLATGTTILGKKIPGEGKRADVRRSRHVPEQFRRITTGWLRCAPTHIINLESLLHMFPTFAHSPLP